MKYIVALVFVSASVVLLLEAINNPLFLFPAILAIILSIIQIKKITE